MTLLLVVGGALLVTSLFFHLVAAVGMIRLPDFYTRMHAVSTSETAGVVLTLGALAVWEGPTTTTLKLGLVAVFLFLANPTSTHVIGRAALRTGLRPWRRRTPGEGEEGR